MTRCCTAFRLPAPQKRGGTCFFLKDLNEYPKCDLGGGFKRYLMFTSTWGNDPI